MVFNTEEMMNNMCQKQNYISYPRDQIYLDQNFSSVTLPPRKPGEGSSEYTKNTDLVNTGLSPKRETSEQSNKAYGNLQAYNPESQSLNESLKQKTGQKTRIHKSKLSNPTTNNLNDMLSHMTVKGQSPNASLELKLGERQGFENLKCLILSKTILLTSKVKSMLTECG